MKSFAAALIMVSSALAGRNSPIKARQPLPQVILPTRLEIHNVNAGDNAFSTHTNTVRDQTGSEISTLYSVTFPASTAGLTCSATFFAGLAADDIRGTGEIDFFSTGIQDLAAQASGNLRDAALGRLQFDGRAYPFVFEADFPAPFQHFPCPAGRTVVYESVAVGEHSAIIVGQDLVSNGAATPNGLSFTAY